MSLAALFTLSMIWKKSKWHLSNCGKHTQQNAAQQKKKNKNKKKINNKQYTQ